MGYAFNPFTNKLDNVGTALAAGSVFTGGTDKYVLFNDGGTLGQDSGFQYTKATDALNVAGTITSSHATIGFVVGSGSGYWWSGLGAITSSADGVFNFRDNGGTKAISFAMDVGFATFGGAIAVNAAALGSNKFAVAGSSLFTGATVTSNLPVISASQSWNAAVAFNLATLNLVSAGAATAASNLLDMQIGGTTKTSVALNGSVRLAGGYPQMISGNGVSGGSAFQLYQNSTTTELDYGSLFTLYDNNTSKYSMNFVAETAKMSTTGVFGFCTNATAATLDTAISKISAGLFGLGTGAQGSFAGSVKLTDVFTNNATAIMRTTTTITGGGVGNVPTLTAGPVTGNPTKWLPYDDNGTTRYIPAW